MFDDRWQLISRDTKDIFGVIRGNATLLSTVEIPNYGFEDRATMYESCLFTEDTSEVLCRYLTKEEATRGHAILAKKYKLR